VIDAWILRELNQLAEQLESARSRAGAEHASSDEFARYACITGYLSAECESAAINLRSILSALRAKSNASEAAP